MEEAHVKRYWLFSLVSGLLFGVWFASLGIVSFRTAYIILVLSGVLGIYAFFCIRHAQFRPLVWFLLVFLCACSCGIVRFEFATLPIDHGLQSSVGKRVVVEGAVTEESKLSNTYRQYIIETNSGVRVLVRGQLFPRYAYGDVLSVRGTIEYPKVFTTEDGVVFDYPAYLSKEGISYVMSFSSAEKVGEKSWYIQKLLFRGKGYFVESLKRVIPYPESGLLSGILLGIQDGMGKEMLNTFRLVGIIHIVVLSGYNITIVAESVRKALSFLSMRNGLFAGAFSILIFCMMVGFTPSVVRAAVMAILAIIARATRRTYDVGRALACAALLMVLWNPKLLLFDIGFQLSFLATIALIWISPWAQKNISWVPERFGFQEILSTTLSVQLFVLPFLMYTNGTISLSGFVVNLLVLPLVPSIMMLGLITGLCSMVSPALAFIPALITRLCLSYILWIAELFVRIPGSIISHVSISGLAVVCIYGLFGLWVFRNSIISYVHQFKSIAHI